MWTQTNPVSSMRNLKKLFKIFQYPHKTRWNQQQQHSVNCKYSDSVTLQMIGFCESLHKAQNVWFLDAPFWMHDERVFSY